MFKKFLFVCVILFVSQVLFAIDGKSAYEKSCLQCHGDNGAGVNDPKISGPNLPILKEDYAKEQFELILNGSRKGEGAAAMAKFLNETKLTKEDLSAALKYALTLKESSAFHVGGGDPAQGKLKYDTICLHCHGAEGEGYANPALPAPRLSGQADFYIINQIKSFRAGHRDGNSPASQQMKAMSMALTSDKEIQDVAAYIRSLDKLTGPDLQNLTYKVYHGSWGKMPDFKKLQVSKEGKIDDGFVDIKVAELPDNYAVVFEADLVVPEDGEYTFVIGSDDGSQLFLNDKMVINNDGIHHVGSTNKGVVKLTRGKAKFLLSYFEKTGQEGLELVWKNKAWKNFRALTSSAKIIMASAKSESRPIQPDKSRGEAIVFRNFIKDASPRSIGVGYPEAVNIVFDASNMNLAMMWQGDFLDGAEMFKGRGTAFMEPQGASVKIGKSSEVALLENDRSPWVDLSRKANEIRKNDLRFNGYTLDSKRYPTFMYSLAEIKFTDFFQPLENKSGIKRKIIAVSEKATDKLWFRVAVDSIKKENEFYVVNNSYKVNVKEAILREFGKIQELLIPFKFSGNNAVIEIDYLFKGEAK